MLVLNTTSPRGFAFGAAAAPRYHGAVFERENRFHVPPASASLRSYRSNDAVTRLASAELTSDRRRPRL